MRNLKRVLSLVMAVAMLIGLMVVSASAASTYDNFTDKDEIVNTEAVNTLVSLGVLNGKEDGSYFAPADIVTRAEMAKIITVCLNGGKDPLLSTAVANTGFTDVSSNYWAAPYIAYCANVGIINGKGDGTFGPEEPVTGTAAAKMFLCALGYRADIEGLTGANWALNTEQLANEKGLYDDMNIVPSSGLSRDNTAQLVYNGIQAQEVEYKNNYGEYSGVIYAQNKGTMLANRFGVVKVEGVVVANEIFGLSGYSATPTGKARFVDCNSYNVVQNGVTTTKYYDNVYPVSISNDYVGQRVVIYVKFPNALAPNATDCVVIGEPILSDKNTVASTGAKLGDTDKVKSFLRDNDLSIGAEQLDNGKANTNRGVLTVANNVFNFVDGDNVSLSAGINARGTKITFIDNTGDGTVDYILKETKHLAKVTVYNKDKSELTLAGVGTINFKDIANEDIVAAGDIVLFTKYNDTYYFDIPETVKGTFSAYNADATTMIMDGTSYASTSVGFNAASTDLMPYTISKDEIGNTYTLYLDDFGNVIAVELADEALGNYALVLKTATTASGSSSVLNKGEVKLLKADGTTSTYTVNLAASGARFGWASATNSTKETNMIGLLNNDLNDNGVIDTGEVSVLTNTIVTYIVGEDGTVTLGNPAQETAYDSLYRAAGVGTVKSTQTSYTFAAGSDKDGATAAFPGHSTTAAGTTVVMNDSTMFFFRDATNNDHSDPVVVQGLKNLPASAITGSKLISAVYRTDTTGTNVAKAVYVDAAYEGAVNYLYLVADYTATELSSTGERIYTYPVVFEDGTAGTIKVREANNTGFTSGSIYAYTTDDEYCKLDPSKEIAPNATGANTPNKTVNGYVVVHSQNDTITMQWGLNNDPATNNGNVQKAFKVNSSTKVYNVEDGAKPYETSLSANSTVALATDSDGFVRVAFVKDSNVSFRSVTNNTGANLTVANVPAAKQNFTGTLAHGASVTVASGFSFSFDQTYNVAATYSKTTDGGEKTEGLTVKGNTSNYASITMPAYASLNIGTGSSTPTPTGKTLTVDVGTYGSAKIYDKDGNDITATFVGNFYKKSATVPVGNVIIVNTSWNVGDEIWINNTKYTVGSRQEIQLNITADTELKALHAVNYAETKYDTNKLTLGAADILVEDGSKGELVLPLTCGSLTQNTRVAFTGATVKSVSGTGVSMEGGNVVVASTASGAASITVEVTNVTAPVTVTSTGTQVFATGSLAVAEPTSGSGKNVTVGVTADVAYVASGETVTYTITVATADAQTTAADSDNDTITVTFTNGGTMVTGTDNVENGTGSVSTNTAVITINGNSTTVSGTYTVTSATVSGGDVTIAAAYAAAP